MNATKVASASGTPSVFMLRAAAPEGGGGGGDEPLLLAGVVGGDGVEVGGDGVVGEVVGGLPAATTVTVTFMPLAQ
ncbi:hypothetical protein GCM10023197_05960 [Gordonia humi]